jgi:murein DD-endopeptidase MepM/ murein hydrolase activator NlpD
MAKLGLLILSEEPHDMEHVKEAFLAALEAITGGPVDLSPREPVVPPPIVPPPPPVTHGAWERVVPGGTGIWYSGGTHGGYPAADIFAAKGSNILAPVAGRLEGHYSPLGGNSAILFGADGKFYYFAHMQDAVPTRQMARGAVVGHVGNTGNAAGTLPHLHFAIASRIGIFSERNGSGDQTQDMSG